jgi:hypothetical protein
MGRVREACREKDPGCSGGYREHGVSERGRQPTWLSPPFFAFNEDFASCKGNQRRIFPLALKLARSTTSCRVTPFRYDRVNPDMDLTNFQ